MTLAISLHRSEHHKCCSCFAPPFMEMQTLYSCALYKPFSQTALQTTNSMMSCVTSVWRQTFLYCKCAILTLKLRNNWRKQTFSSRFQLKVRAEGSHWGSFPDAPMSSEEERLKLGAPKLTSPTFWPVWTRGQKLSFKQSCGRSDNSQIASSSSVIFSLTASLVSVSCAGCVGTLAGALLFRSDTQQSDVTHWRLRWQPGRQGHTVTYF